MSIFNATIKRYKRLTPKQLILGSVFMLMLVGATGAGLASQKTLLAAPRGDCSPNSIDNQDLNGGCGATTIQELCDDIVDFRAVTTGPNKHPADLDNIYYHGPLPLPAGQCSNLTHAVREGWVYGPNNSGKYASGDVVVDNQVVMTGVWTMGRNKFNEQRVPIVIDDVTYYHSPPSASFADGVQRIKALVMFDGNGKAEFVVLEPCGNPITRGNKRTPVFECTALNKNEVAGQDNTYTFTTTVKTDEYNLAKVEKVEYYVDYENDGKRPELFNTQTNPATPTPAKTFDKSATVSVNVTFKLPGNKYRTVVAKDFCIKKIEVKKRVFHVCKELIGKPFDNNTFRFTVYTLQSPGVTVKNASLKLDDGATTVVPANDQGKVVADYDFDDYNEHTVMVKQIVFVVDGVDVTVVTPEGKCQDTVKRVREVFHYCKELAYIPIDDDTFRFSVVTHQSPGVSVKNASLKLDGGPAVVVTANNQGEVVKDYSFDDFDKHTVKVTQVVFVVDGTDVTITTPEGKCQRDVQRECKASVICDKLISTRHKSDPNTYTFTTKAILGPGTEVTRVVYTITEEGQPVKTVTTHSLSEEVTHTFGADADVKATVYGKIPGGEEVSSDDLPTRIASCRKHIKFVPKQHRFFYACTNLQVMPVKDDPQSFIFTVYTDQSPNVTVKDARFTVSGYVEAQVVVDPKRDSNGNIYKEFTLADGDEDEHIVQAVVFFDTPEGVKSDSGFHCKAKFKAKEQPKCQVPGYENLPPNDPKCAYCPYNRELAKDDPKCKPQVEECLPGVPKGDDKCYCKRNPDIPVGDYRCNPPQVKCDTTTGKGEDCPPLVNTGPAGVAGLFTGITAAGAVGHRLLMNYRRRGQ